MAKKVQNKKNTAGAAVAHKPTPNKAGPGAKGGKPAGKPATPVAKKQQQQKQTPQKKQVPAKKEVPAKKVEEEKKVLQEADDDSSSGEIITEEQFNEMLKNGEITEADLAALQAEGSDEEIELTEEQIQEMIKNGEITLEDLENAAAGESDSEDSEVAQKTETVESKDVEMTEAAAPAPVAAAPVTENKNSKKRKAEEVAATETPVANSPKKQKTSNNAVMFQYVDFGTRTEEFKSFVTEKCGAVRDVVLAGYNARVVFEDEKSVGKALALNKVEFRSKQLRVFNLDKSTPTTALKAFCKIDDFSDDEVTKFFSSLTGVASVEVRPTGGVYNVANVVMKSLESAIELVKKVDVTFKGVPVIFDYKFLEKDAKKGPRMVSKKAAKKVAA